MLMRCKCSHRNFPGSREFLIVGSLFYIVSLIDIQKTFYKCFISFQLLEHNISQHIGFSSFFVKRVLDCRRSLLKNKFNRHSNPQTDQYFGIIFVKSRRQIKMRHQTKEMSRYRGYIVKCNLQNHCILRITYIFDDIAQIPPNILKL